MSLSYSINGGAFTPLAFVSDDGGQLLVDGEATLTFDTPTGVVPGDYIELQVVFDAGYSDPYYVTSEAFSLLTVLKEFTSIII